MLPSQILLLLILPRENLISKACVNHEAVDRSAYTPSLISDFVEAVCKVYTLVSIAKYSSLFLYIYEPHHEKTGFLHVRKQRHRSAVHDQCLCFRYIGSMVPLFYKSEISSL